MSNIYAWPGAGTPPEPIKPMFFLDSNTHKLSVKPGVYGAIFNPGFQDNAGLQWWADYFAGKPHDPLGHLANLGVVVDFIHADIEWKENVLPFPYIDSRTVADRFITIKTILRRCFPTVPICFYGDRWSVDEVAPTGNVTGHHLFHGWQERDPRPLGTMPNYVNMFWNHSWATDHALRLTKTHHVIHWIEDAKVWGQTVGANGKPAVEQTDAKFINPIAQRLWGQSFASVKRPVMLYAARDWKHPNAVAFVDGLRAASVPVVA